MMHRGTLGLAIAAALLISAAGPAQAADEIMLGGVSLAGTGDRDVLDLPACKGSSNQPVVALQAAVANYGAHVERLKVVFQNGGEDVLHVRKRLEAGKSSRWIDLLGAARCIDKIVVVGTSAGRKPGKEARISFRGRTSRAGPPPVARVVDGKPGKVDRSALRGSAADGQEFTDFDVVRVGEDWFLKRAVADVQVGSKFSRLELRGSELWMSHSSGVVAVIDCGVCYITGEQCAECTLESTGGSGTGCVCPEEGLEGSCQATTKFESKLNDVFLEEEW
jgi:hypothetical protein